MRLTDKLWMAPELLRLSRVPAQGTTKGDIYSLAIVMSEILSRERAYGTYEDMSNEGKLLSFIIVNVFRKSHVNGL